jgi:hypothetical protein
MDSGTQTWTILGQPQMEVDTDGPLKTAVLLFPKLKSRVRIPFPAPEIRFKSGTSVLIRVR